MSRHSPGTRRPARRERGLDRKPTRTITWRTASFHRARELLLEASDAQANHDPIRLQTAMDQLRALPGFPRSMAPTDRLLIEEIPPIISLGG